jgi:hypothetical protein
LRQKGGRLLILKCRLWSERRRAAGVRKPLKVSFHAIWLYCCAEMEYIVAYNCFSMVQISPPPYGVKQHKVSWREAKFEFSLCTALRFLPRPTLVILSLVYNFENQHNCSPKKLPKNIMKNILFQKLERPRGL